MLSNTKNYFPTYNLKIFQSWVKFTSIQKSPLMVPGLLSLGLVSPNITRPVLTAPRPSQHIATTGPELMYFTSPG